jgi:hypothetical protein
MKGAAPMRPCSITLDACSRPEAAPGKKQNSRRAFLLWQTLLSNAFPKKASRKPAQITSAFRTLRRVVKRKVCHFNLPDAPRKLKITANETG